MSQSLLDQGKLSAEPPTATTPLAAVSIPFRSGQAFGSLADMGRVVRPSQSLLDQGKLSACAYDIIGKVVGLNPF